MMPNPDMMKGAAMMGPGRQGPPMKPGADMMGGGSEAASPDDVKRQMVGLLKQIKQAAEANGVDWNEVLSEVEGNKSKASATLPRPPAPPAGMPPMMG